MTAGEDQAQLVVGDDLGVGHRGGVGERPLLGVRLGAGLEVERRAPPAAQHVQRPAASGHEEPRAGPRRDPVHPPTLERRHERVLDDRLRFVEVAQHARHRGQHAAPLLPVEALEQRLEGFGRAHTGQIGRTSTVPCSALGQRAAQSTASSREAHSTR